MPTINPRATENRSNKQFIIKNSKNIKKYALNSQKKFGNGIIVINLTLVENGLLTEQDLIVRSVNQDHESKNEEKTLVSPISYVINNSFWFKIIRIKIKKKYGIDIKTDYDLDKQFLLVFVKEPPLKFFSTYSIKNVKINTN